MRGQIANLKFMGGPGKQAFFGNIKKKLRKVYSTQEQQCKKHTYVSIGSPIFVNVTKSALKNINIYIYDRCCLRKKSIFVKNCSIYENLLFALPELFTRSKHPNQKKKFNDHCFNCSDIQVE
jgi:hypothetical protein